MVNSSAEVVGSAISLTTGDTTAVEWPDSATPTDLGALPGIKNTVVDPQATSINDNGLIREFGSEGHRPALGIVRVAAGRGR